MVSEDTCPGFMAKAEKVEKALHRAIKELAESCELQSAAEAEIVSMLSQHENELRSERSRLRKELDGIPAKRDSLFSQLIAGNADASVLADYEKRFAGKAEELEAAISAIDSELADMDSQEVRARAARAALADFPTVWDRLDIKEKRALISNLVESLTLTREGPNVIMRLKLIFREEKEIIIPPDKREPTEKTGVGSLTQRQMAILDLLSQGRSRKELVQRLGIQETAVNSHMWFVRRNLGVATNEEAIELAWPRIEAEREFLPRDGRSRPPVTRGGKVSALEIDLLRRLAAGESLCSVARTDGKAVGTVSMRLTSAKRKLGVTTRDEAIGRARELGLV